MGGLRDLGLFGLLIPEQYGETMPQLSDLECNNFNFAGLKFVLGELCLESFFVVVHTCVI